MVMKHFLVVRVVTAHSHQVSRSIVMAALALVLPSLLATAQTTLSLAQCLRQAQSNNSQVQQAAWQEANAAINVQQAKDNFWPQLDASTYHGINQGRTINPFDNSYINKQLSSANLGLQGNLLLFNGLRFKHQLQQNRLAHESSQATLQLNKDRTSLETVLAYLQVLNLEDQGKQLEQQMQVTRQALHRQRSLLEEGATKPELASNLEGQLAGEEVQLDNTRTQIAIARQSLADLMNVPLDPQWVLERLPLSDLQTAFPMPQAVYEQIASRFPAIVAAEKELHSAEFGVKVARTESAPAIGLNANLGTNYSSIATDANNEKIGYGEQIINNYGTSAGIYLAVPILNRRLTRNQTNRANAERSWAEQRLQTARHQLLSTLQNAHQNLLNAANRFAKLDIQVTAYQESFRIAQVKLDQGVIHSVEYLTTKDFLDRARLDQINARYEYYLRKIVYDFFQTLQWPGQ